MVPRTSVLGHMLIVAILSYLFSLEIGASEKRCINNYFTGLFHDLPEVLTRDIISPVKNSINGLDDLIKEYEKREMERRIYRIIPDNWHSEIRMFTEHEFDNIITIEDGNLGQDDISEEDNKKLIKLLENEINVNLPDKPEIIKTDRGRSIHIPNNGKSYEIKIDNIDENKLKIWIPNEIITGNYKNINCCIPLFVQQKRLPLFKFF
jgi:hypothetical protein